MKHFKLLFELRSKIYDGRTTRKSMCKAAQQYVELFESKDELTIELNEYKISHSQWALPPSVVIPLAYAANNLPGKQTIPWTVYDSSIYSATFEEYVQYLEDLYTNPGFDSSMLDEYREFFKKENSK